MPSSLQDHPCLHIYAKPWLGLLLRVNRTNECQLVFEIIIFAPQVFPNLRLLGLRTKASQELKCSQLQIGP